MKSVSGASVPPFCVLFDSDHITAKLLNASRDSNSRGIKSFILREVVAFIRSSTVISMVITITITENLAKIVVNWFQLCTVVIMHLVDYFQ